MALSTPAERSLVNRRRVHCECYERRDGLWDVEGHIVDIRDEDAHLQVEPRVVPAGEHFHEMRLRLTVDEKLEIHAVEAELVVGPTPICAQAPPAMQALVGLRIRSGWMSEVNRRLGGPQSCTHLRELLGPMSTTIMQGLIHRNIERTGGASFRQVKHGRPVALDTCFAFAAGRVVAKQLWPEFHTEAAAGVAAKE